MGIELRRRPIIALAQVTRCTLHLYAVGQQACREVLRQQERRIGYVALYTEYTSVRRHTTGQITAVLVGQAVHKRSVIVYLGASDMILECQSGYVGQGLDDRSHTAYRSATQLHMTGIVHIGDSKDTGGVVVTHIFPNPSGIKGIAVVVGSIADNGTGDDANAGFAYGVRPMIEEVSTAIQITQCRVSIAAYVEVAVQHTLADIAAVGYNSRITRRGA